jgi:hypothetical protein
MSREEYVKKREALQQELSELLMEYIGSNSPLPIGTKVKVHYKHYGANYPTGYYEYGIITGYDTYLDEIIPIVAKIKKDGTAHATARLYVSSIENVEVCD